MTRVRINPAGIARLAARLDAGEPVVVPLPSPLPYVLVGAVPGALNAAKGRPPSQPVGAVLRSLDTIRAGIELDDAGIELTSWLLLEHHAGVLVPVNGLAPLWLSPAITAGRAFLGAAWLPQLVELLSDAAQLYMTSANLTGGQPALTAPDAEAAFGRQLLVADGDAFRDSRSAHGSSTMITVDTGPRLSIVREGINNAAFSGDPDGYCAWLLERWQLRRRPLP